MTLTSADKEITDDEAKLYDRQIRLWGVQAQKQLRRAHVALFGLNGSGSEIAKNVVLSGVQCLHIIEHEPVTELDALCGLYTRQQINQNRGKASEAHLRALNPMVNLQTHEWDVSKAIEDQNETLLQLLKQVHVVCVNSANAQVITKLNSLVRELRSDSVKFYATGSWGYYAFAFNDLGPNYKYHVEEVVSRELDVSGETARKRLKTEIKEKTKSYVEKSLEFVSFDEMIKSKITKKRVNPTILLVHVMFRFHSKFGRFPVYTSRQSDQQSLEELAQEVIADLGMEKRSLEKLNNQDCWNNIFGEISPVTAILGAVVGQDIIRTITGYDPPIRNVFLFNGFECSGSIESIGR